MATQSPTHIRRRHINGEHTTWCSERKAGVIVCKYTGRPIKQVGSPVVAGRGDRVMPS
jgi:hypothetical protein